MNTNSAEFKYSEFLTGYASNFVLEFIHTIADQSAALCAEKGTCRIDGDKVKNFLEELLPSAEILLNLNNQASANPYFTEEGWLTVESVLRILEDQYLKQIKRKEFPPNVSQKKGKETMQSMRGEIMDFIKMYDPKKVLPQVGNPINTVFKYHDGTRSLSDDQRDSITQYLCTFQEVRSLSHIDNASLIHSLIEFIIKRQTDNDLHQNKILSWLFSVDSVIKALGETIQDEDDLVGLTADSLPY
ncbi:unnamed protein product [Mytilus coruscus]|uniref:Uncharacterized protein n=1 Tax=Mytilus coruscus TaxID=42192 RepID=A0A6J8A4E3_MYTCO|nr:unnamed protein product [Mytilus coruscus]